MELKNLRRLIDASGLTRKDLAEVTGVSVSLITNILAGRMPLSLNSATKFADFFAVPLDVIVDRCSEEEAETVLKDYSRNFMKLRRAAYEAYRFGAKMPRAISGFEQPYPYNLVAAVLGDTDYNPESPLTSDQEKGIEVALSELSPREEFVVVSIFEGGMSLEKVGRELNVTRERARQIYEKGTRKLRHMPRLRYITEGYETTIKRFAEREAEAEKREEALLKKEKGLDEFGARLRELEAELKTKFNSQLDSLKITTDVDGFPYIPRCNPEKYSLSDLNLSVKVYNCFTKWTEIRTVADLLEYIQKEKP